MADALLLTELKERENTMIMFMVGLLYRLRLYCCVAETKPRNSCGFVGAHHLAPQAPRTEVTLDSRVCSRRELTIEDAWHRLELCTTPCRVQPSRTHASVAARGGNVHPMRDM